MSNSELGKGTEMIYQNPHKILDDPQVHKQQSALEADEYNNHKYNVDNADLGHLTHSHAFSHPHLSSYKQDDVYTHNKQDRKDENLIECHCNNEIMPMSNENDSILLKESRILYIAWIFIGIGFLFPYNSVITAVDYFQCLYDSSIDFYFSWLLICPNFIILAYSVKYGLPGTHYSRIITSMVIMAVFVIIIPLLNENTEGLLFLCTFLVGVFEAIMQGTCYNLLGYLGPDLTSSFQTGTGLGGAIVGIIRIMTKFLYGSPNSNNGESLNDLRKSTYIYFGIALLILISDILIYHFVIDKSETVKLIKLENNNGNSEDIKKMLKMGKKEERLKTDDYYYQSIASPQKDNNTKKIMCPHGSAHAPNSNNKSNSNESKFLSFSTKTSYGSMENKSNSSNGYSINNKFDDSDMAVSLAVLDDLKYSEHLSVCQLWVAIWQYSLCVYLNYIVTLSLFPGVISLQSWNITQNDGLFAILQIFLFNMVDTLGKFLSSYDILRDVWNKNLLLFATMLRFLFVPLFILCVNPQIFSWHYAILFNFLMAITNGYLASVALCLAPQSINNISSSQRGQIGDIMVFSLTFGLVCGATLGFVFKYIIQYGLL